MKNGLLQFIILLNLSLLIVPKNSNAQKLSSGPQVLTFFRTQMIQSNLTVYTFLKITIRQKNILW